MKNMHKIKEMLCEELEQYGRKGELSAGSLDAIHKLTDTIKNIYKIELLEEEEESSYEGGSSGARRGGGGGGRGGRGGRSRESGGGSSYEGGESYDDDASYARRRRDRMGRYSGEGGYSQGGGKEEMLQMIDEMMGQAETEKQREALHRCRTELSRA